MEPYKAYKIDQICDQYALNSFYYIINLKTQEKVHIKKSNYVLPSEPLEAGDIIQCDNKAHITFVYANRKGYTGIKADSIIVDELSKQPHQNILDEAKQIIYGDREKIYGHPAKNLETIAGFWQQYIKAKFKTHLQLTPADVCAMMRFVKESRLINTPNHRDSLVDIAGYTALQDRLDEKPAA